MMQTKMMTVLTRLGEVISCFCFLFHFDTNKSLPSSGQILTTIPTFSTSTHHHHHLPLQDFFFFLSSFNLTAAQLHQQTLGLTAEDYCRLLQTTVAPVVPVVPVVPVENDISVQHCAALL